MKGLWAKKQAKMQQQHKISGNMAQKNTSDCEALARKKDDVKKNNNQVIKFFFFFQDYNFYLLFFIFLCQSTVEIL